MESFIYRKLSNNKSFYKIISKNSFEEIKIIGKNHKHYIYEVSMYPDLLFINDLVNLSHQGILQSTIEEWEKLLRIC